MSSSDESDSWSRGATSSVSTSMSAVEPVETAPGRREPAESSWAATFATEEKNGESFHGDGNGDACFTVRAIPTTRSSIGRPLRWGPWPDSRCSARGVGPGLLDEAGILHPAGARCAFREPIKDRHIQPSP